jgi:ribosome-associated translation inhibitor RaiA
MLCDFAHRKLAKVPHFSSDALRMDLILRRHGGAADEGRFSASARLALPGRDIHATAAHADLYTAIVKLVGRLVRLSRKRKVRRARAFKSHRRSARGQRRAMPREGPARWKDSPEVWDEPDAFIPVLDAPATHRDQAPRSTSPRTIGLIERSSSSNPAHGISFLHLEQLAACSRAPADASGI